MPIEIESVRKTYAGRPVLDGVDLVVPPGGLCALLGPSGSGKSTLLSLVAGLLRPDGGRIRLRGRTVHDARVCVPARTRRVGLVFQDLALWPHLTVRDHLRFVAPAEDPTPLLETFALSAHAGALPDQLSGGEARRLALARALATRPDVLLLDEPLSGIDRRLGERLLDRILEAHRRFGTTTILVTHAYEEAFRAADQLAVLIEGQVVQQGDPEAVYRAPTSEAVARLTGPVTPWPREDGTLCWARPEELSVREDPGGEARLLGATYLGGRWEIRATLRGAKVRAFTSRRPTGPLSIRRVPPAASAAGALRRAE